MHRLARKKSAWHADHNDGLALTIGEPSPNGQSRIRMLIAPAFVCVTTVCVVTTAKNRHGALRMLCSAAQEML